jgi:hypothetical protein
MAEAGYRPKLPPRQIPVAGDVGIATFKMMLVNMLEGRFISEHDMEVSTRIATVMCGGNVDRGSLVDEEWLLALEREHFVALALMPKTQERIAYTLKKRQAAEELTDMSKQIQDAYIVAATRRPVGKRRAAPSATPTPPTCSRTC